MIEHVDIAKVNYAKIGVENDNVKGGEVFFDVGNKKVRLFLGDLMVPLCGKEEFFKALKAQPVFEGGVFTFKNSEFDVLYIETETEVESSKIILHYE